MSKLSTLLKNSTFSHIWTITDFSHQLIASSVEHPCLNSCTFPSTSSNTKSPNQFRLNLYPKGINASFSDYLSIGFGTISPIENEEKITVWYRVSLIDSKGECRYAKEWLYIFSTSKRVSVFGRFISKSEFSCPSNGLLTDDNLVLHCEGTVLGDPSALDFTNTNLADLKFITKCQPDLMVDILFNLATKHRLTYYSPNGIPNFEIQNLIEETFSYSYKANMYEDQIFTWSQSKYMKSTEELKLLSHREMLHLLSVWMVSGKHADLSLVFQGDQGEKVLNVHKIVLLNRSSAFDVLLQQNSRVSIVDVPIDVFGKLIQFLYTGKVQLLKKYQYELLDVSFEYGFDLLNQMSQLTLCDEITTENVFDVLIEANKASVGLLKQACLEYISKHATQLMFDLPDSLKPELIEEMYRNLASKHRQAESHYVYDQRDIPNFAIQNQVDETFAYTHISTLFDEALSCSAWSNSKYNTKGTQELMHLSRRLMLDTLDYWMNSGDYGDLSFVVGEQEEMLSLHSIVLLNRSSAFDSFLHNKTIVTVEQTKRVSIADAPIEEISQLIQFLYTGKVPLLKEYQYKLLAVSCTLDFDVLKQMCELSICDQIANENAINMLILASEASCGLLKRAALEYIIEHTTELMFDLPNSLKPELIGEMYRNLALKNALNESEDRLVYGHFQPLIVSNGIDESLSYTRLNMYHLFNEFTFKDYVADFTSITLNGNAFESHEFCASENSSLKFQIFKQSNRCTDLSRQFALMVKDADSRRFDISKPQVSLIRYNVSLGLCLSNEYYETLDTCDGVEYLKVSSNYTRLGNRMSLQNQEKLDYYYPNRNSEHYPLSTFKIRSEITALCGFSALDLSPFLGLTQLELAQSRKHLLECINSLLRKCDGDQKKLSSLHAIVLQNRSSAFDVLVHKIVTKLYSKVSSGDVPIEVFDQLIHYLYSGKVPLLKKYQYELLNVSYEYGFDVLKQMCELTICDQITTENAINMLILANVASAKRLKQTALEYITDHATELMFELPDSLKRELIGEMYCDLALKNALNELKDRQVYENFQPSVVSNEIEESFSYTRLKMYHISNEFTFDDNFCEVGNRHAHSLDLFESHEFCSLENPTLKFKLVQLPVDSVECSDFDLMAKDGDSRRFDLSQPQVSLISYKMSLSFGSNKYSLGTCEDIQYWKVSSNYTRLHNKFLFQIPDKLDNYFPDRNYEKYLPSFGTFKMRSEINVLCDISALDLSPIKGISQSELEQSRKHLLECINSSMLKRDDDKRDVTLVVRGTEFKVHGIFLAQSPVLEALVSHSNRISISELSIEAFGPFVQYLYTGKVQSLDKYAKKLLFVACKNKLKILMQMCLLQTRFQVPIERK